MIPVHIAYRKSEPPQGTHYILARNGLFLHKTGGWVDAVIPVHEMRVLEPVQTSIKLNLPPLDGRVLAEAREIFRAVFGKYKSEVCVLLHYHAEHGYKLTVPQQRVAPASVEYDATERIPEYMCVGTIHSHASFDAFHSGTDLDDEAHWDGVHITLGNIGSYPRFSLSAEIVVNDHRVPVEPTWFKDLLPQHRKLHDINIQPQDIVVPDEALLWTKVRSAFSRR